MKNLGFLKVHSSLVKSWVVAATLAVARPADRRKTCRYLLWESPDEKLDCSVRIWYNVTAYVNGFVYFS